jgi:hypothetical protein
MKSSIGTQCDKSISSREISNSWEYFKVSGVVNENLLKQLVGRPMSPIKLPVKSVDYIASSKRRLMHRSYDFSYEASSKIIRNSQNSRQTTRSSSQNDQRKLVKTSKRMIKYKKSPELLESDSNASICYYLPRYG